MRQYGRPSDSFAMIRNAFIRDAEVKPSAFRVAVWVMSHDNTFEITQERIGRALAMSTTTVRAAFKQLEDLGYLVRVDTRDARGHRAPDELYLSQERFTDAERLELRRSGQCSDSQGRESEHAETSAPKEDHSKQKTKPKEEKILPGEPGESPAVDVPVIPKDQGRKDGLTNDVLDAEFAAWYAAWPKKVAKGSAQRAYRAARRQHAVTAAELLDAVGPVRARWDRAPGERTYIPYPATWLNGERWLDDLAESPHLGTGKVAAPHDWDAYAARDDLNASGIAPEDQALMDKFSTKRWETPSDQEVT